MSEVDRLGDLFEELRDAEDILHHPVSMQLCDLIQRRVGEGKRTRAQKISGFPFFDWLAVRLRINAKTLNLFGLRCECDECTARMREAKEDFEREMAVEIDRALAEWDSEFFRRVSDAMIFLEKNQLNPSLSRASRINTLVYKAFAALFFETGRLPTVVEWREETRRHVQKVENAVLDDAEWGRARKHFSMNRLHRGVDERVKGSAKRR